MKPDAVCGMDVVLMGPLMVAPHGVGGGVRGVRTPGMHWTDLIPGTKLHAWSVSICLTPKKNMCACSLSLSLSL